MIDNVCPESVTGSLFAGTTRIHRVLAALNWRAGLSAAAIGLIGPGLVLPTAGLAAPAQAREAKAKSGGTPSVSFDPTLAPQKARPRVIVTTDGEQDDLASMHRFILDTNDLDVLGIVQSSSVFHWSGDATTSPPTPQVTWLDSDWIYANIRSYAQAYPNLKANDPRFPPPAQLERVVTVGNISNVGEYSKNTAGSDWIRRILLEPGNTNLH